jgi:hypothetical protein
MSKYIHKIVHFKLLEIIILEANGIYLPSKILT